MRKFLENYDPPPGRSILCRCQDYWEEGGGSLESLRLCTTGTKPCKRDYSSTPHPKLTVRLGNIEHPAYSIWWSRAVLCVSDFSIASEVFNLLRFSHPFVLLFCLSLVRRLSLPVIHHTVAARSGPSVSCAGPRTFWLSVKRYAAPSRQVLNSPPFGPLLTPSELYQFFWN